MATETAGLPDRQEITQDELEAAIARATAAGAGFHMADRTVTLDRDRPPVTFPSGTHLKNIHFIHR